MRFLSLFSGIEAASVAWNQLNWECVAVAEILEYQSEVIKQNYPNIKNLGDVTKISENDIKALGQIDVVIFGSPCQDMSYAGKRAGLDSIKSDKNHSSILFYDGMRVFRLAQKYCGARFLVWENVPGALSSNKGVDFGKIIKAMVGVEFNSERLIWGNEGMCFGENSMLEWAVLDSQWFGVPQRRRRVFVVLDTGNWENRPSILFEQRNLRQINKKDSKAKESITSKIETCIEPANGVNFSCAIAGNVIGRNPELRTGGNGKGFNEYVMYTLTATDRHAIAYSVKGSTDYHVRKLTAIEGERLQGFPDNWTLLDSGSSYNKRLNALGRSMAVPVIKWIGNQIEKSII